MRKVNVRSGLGNWVFFAPDDKYFKGAFEINEEDTEYYAIRKLFHQHYDSTYKFVDIGAHIGLASIGLAKDGIQCVCFEPIRENVELFQHSVSENCINRNVVIRRSALSNKFETKVPIFIPRNADNTSLDSDIAVINMKDKQYEMDLTITEKFDDVSFYKNSIGMVKIDVQGFELEVLEGMEKFLTECVKGTRFVIEVDPKFLTGRGFKEDAIHKKLEKFDIHFEHKLNSVNCVFDKFY